MRKSYKLSDVFDLQMGKTPDRHNTEYWENGVHPWISIADLSNNGKFVETTKEFITERAVFETGIKPIYPGTVIMSFKLSVGKVAMVRTKPHIAYSNEAIMAFEVRNDIPENEQPLNEYVYYLLSSLNFDNIGNKAVMGKTLNKAILQDLSVKIHPKEEQCKIIDVLTQCDSLIAKRKQQLSKLDELVKARFVELFGDDIKKSDLTISDIAEEATVGIANSATHAYAETGVVMLRNQNIRVNYLDDSDLIYIKPDFAEKYKNKALQENDILVTRTGANVGMACIVPPKYTGCQTFTTLILRLRKDIDISPRFVCHYINSPIGKDFVDENKIGGAQPNFGARQLALMPIVIPSKEKQNAFDKCVEQTDKSKLEIQKSLEKLELLKKALMQKYFG